MGPAPAHRSKGGELWPGITRPEVNFKIFVNIFAKAKVPEHWILSTWHPDDRSGTRPHLPETGSTTSNVKERDRWL